MAKANTAKLNTGKQAKPAAAKLSNQATPTTKTAKTAAKSDTKKPKR